MVGVMASSASRNIPGKSVRSSSPSSSSPSSSMCAKCIAAAKQSGVMRAAPTRAQTTIANASAGIMEAQPHTAAWVSQSGPERQYAPPVTGKVSLAKHDPSSMHAGAHHTPWGSPGCGPRPAADLARSADWRLMGPHPKQNPPPIAGLSSPARSSRSKSRASAGCAGLRMIDLKDRATRKANSPRPIMAVPTTAICPRLPPAATAGKALARMPDTPRMSMPRANGRRPIMERTGIAKATVAPKKQRTSQLPMRRA
mmetsp:Transcript_23915/g.80304  ORF Transcript_23915/g.80304 Transcript_23915/m.80304 type:complete len:255 (-) Transcript_23915:1109-1873(-)